ncbi:MAG: sulfatase-like hydrolase/transferase [Candidatus Aminicenantes bacterium]|nr:sulfatase-like hydrolase/transferase [Candidatus Aminicenantes bacterium]
MSHMKNRVYFVLTLLVLILISVHISHSKTKGKGWNVLLVTIDTLRTDRLSCYSSEHVDTPNIDSLAQRGVLFKRAFAHTPTTLPSHTNILLGTTPLVHGVHQNSDFVVQEKHLTLAEFLKEKGYVTGAFVGAYPLDSSFGLNQGFMTYDDDYGSQKDKGDQYYYVERKADKVVDRSLVWLEKQSSPWFLWVHVFDPHTPYLPPQPYSDEYKEDLYSGEVAYVDSELGRLFEYLDSEKLYEKTLIVLTGDHAEGLGEHGEMTHGFMAYNSTIWIPLLLYFPGIEPGIASDYVGHIDIFPTVCERLKLKKPDSLSGISLIPILREKKLRRGPIYFESLYPYYSRVYERDWAPIRGFIEDKKKFIQSPILEFYDLEKDFYEQNDLAPTLQLDVYEKKLDAIMEEYSDESKQASQRTPDKETLRKLRSLGYVSGSSSEKKDIEFGPEHDVKAILPLYNKSIAARQVYLKGKTQQAIRMLQEVITERKDISLAYSNLATVYKEEGNLGGALLVLEEGLGHLPESHEVISAYANFLTEAGQSDRVISLFKEFQIPEMEEDPELLNFLGIAHTRKGGYNQALQALDKALSIDSELASTYNNKGNAYLSIFLESKDRTALQKALDNYKKAVDIDPQDAVAYNGLGAAYKQMGEVDKAVKSWENALSLQPDYGLPLYNLGYTHMNRGNKQAALKYFRRYMKLYQYNLPRERRKKIEQWMEQLKQKENQQTEVNPWIQ